MTELERLKTALNNLDLGGLPIEDSRLVKQAFDILLPMLESSPGDGKVGSRLNALREGQQLLEQVSQIRQRQSAELDALREVTQNLTSSLDLTQVLHSVLSAVMALVKDVRDTHIFLYDAGKLTFASALFSDGREETPFTGARPHGLTYTVARLAKVQAVEDMSTHPLFKDTGWTGSIVGLPLKIGLRVVGVMTAFRSEAGNFSEDDLRLLHILAEYAAVAVENNRLQNLIDRQAQLDPLTGLNNRRALEEKLESEAHRYTESGALQEGIPGRPTFSLMMIELDGLRQINDRYGRPAGDHVLKEVAYSIAQALRKTDFLARYGGDILAAVLADADREVCLNVASRIQEYAAASRFNLPDISQKALAVSIGIALFPEHGASGVDLLASAGAALQGVRDQQPGKAAFAGPTGALN